MANRNKTRVEPSLAVQRAIRREEVLDLILDADEYTERRLVARHRIVGAIIEYGINNYIVGAGDRIGGLADFLIARMRHRRDLVDKHDLPGDLKALADHMIKQILGLAVRELVIDELNDMSSPDDREIYLLNGHWQATQSLLDEYQHTREVVAKPHQVRVAERRGTSRLKFDDRSYHGRVRGQVVGRGLVSTSIGGAPGYVA